MFLFGYSLITELWEFLISSILKSFVVKPFLLVCDFSFSLWQIWRDEDFKSTSETTENGELTAMWLFWFLFESSLLLFFGVLWLSSVFCPWFLVVISGVLTPYYSELLPSLPLLPPHPPESNRLFLSLNIEEVLLLQGTGPRWLALSHSLLYEHWRTHVVLRFKENFLSVCNVSCGHVCCRWREVNFVPFYSISNLFHPVNFPRQVSS